MTPGDAPDVLVAMNPAALKANLVDLRGGLLIVDSDEFSRTLPLSATRPTRSRTACSRAGSQTVSVPLTSMTFDALKDSGLGKKEAERSKNMFTLGLLSWMYHRPTEGTIRFERTFRRKPEIAAANITAFRAGYNYGETTEAFAVSYEVKSGPHGAWPLPEHLRQPGAGARLAAAGQRSGLPVFLGAYLITLGVGHPARAVEAQVVQASDVPGRGRDRRHRQGQRLRRRARHHDDVGSGVALKAETIGLAVMTELPLVIVDAARRALHRPAHEDRAVRPAAGHVRPQR